MTDSQRLLAEYVQTGADAAFRELVTRYVGLVYSTARRLVDGEDRIVTQKASPVDEEYDSRLVLGPMGSGSNPYSMRPSE